MHVVVGPKPQNLGFLHLQQATHIFIKEKLDFEAK